VLGSALMVRAVSRMQQAAYEKAADDFAASRAVLTTTGNVRTLALVDSNYSMMQMQRDRFVEAVPSLTKSADYFHRLGAPIRELLDRNKIAGCHLALQDFSAAATEDARLAELIGRVEDPEVRNAAKGTGIVDSVHCHGAAVDIICAAHGWECARHGCDFYNILGREAHGRGLVWGGSWRRRDLPHVQAIAVFEQKQLRELKTWEEKDAFVKERLRNGHPGG
jgi:hypothetical protein